jgi:serine/threonine-protein kinase
LNPVAELNTALAGRYDVEREIGAGGMATVYLARDIKHNRRVALKVLRPDLGAVLGVERFLSEIQVTANLQHPNLLPLFDSGEAAGQLFYVMPFVEGESLRVRLDREKQLPVDEAVRIATAIAAALDYAHRHNVIHRDLKPENILLHEGQPVVADFGIALAVSNAGGGRITQTGLSLGTPHYMSPEQATGDRAIDARTDLYSLGAITYEMLTGDPPHTGSTSQAIIARVLTERPRSIRSSRPNVPAHVEAAVEHALEKLPADRFASAHEFADALSGKVILASTAAATAQQAAPNVFGAPRGRRALFFGVGAAVLWAATLAMTAVLARRAPDAPEVRFSVVTPFSGATPPASPLQMAVSPNGRNLAFVADAPAGGGATMVWIRRIGETVATPIAGSESGGGLFWSPDSRFVAYFTAQPNRRIMKVDITGGLPQRVCDVPAGGAGGTWNRDNVILFASGGNLYTVVAASGTPVELNTHGPDGSGAARPAFLPDGRHFLFVAGPASGSPAIFAGSLDGGSVKRVDVAGSATVAYASPGFLIYARAGDLFAQRFSVRGLAVSGEPIHLASDVATGQTGVAAYSVSDNGVLAFRTGATVVRTAEVHWYSRDGKLLGTVGEPGPYSQARLSPDDKRVALVRADPNSGKNDIWTLDLASNIPNRLTFDTARVNDPTWTPDGRSIAFFSRRKGKNDFYQKTLGASTDSVVFESPGNLKYPEDFSSDGRFLLWHRTNQLMALPLTGDRTPMVLGDSAYGKDEGRFAPDGHWVSYGSNESGNWEVHVASFPAFENRHQVSARGGVQGRWRADGKELFYLTPDGKVMSVAVKGAGATTEFAAPVALFPSPLKSPGNNQPQFSVSRDGQRFLFLVPQEQSREAIDPITVVVNWQSGLKK